MPKDVPFDYKPLALLSYINYKYKGRLARLSNGEIWLCPALTQAELNDVFNAIGGKSGISYVKEITVDKEKKCTRVVFPPLPMDIMDYLYTNPFKPSGYVYLNGVFTSTRYYVGFDLNMEGWYDTQEFERRLTSYLEANRQRWQDVICRKSESFVEPTVYICEVSYQTTHNMVDMPCVPVSSDITDEMLTRVVKTVSTPICLTPYPSRLLTKRAMKVYAPLSENLEEAVKTVIIVNELMSYVTGRRWNFIPHVMTYAELVSKTGGLPLYLEPPTAYIYPDKRELADRASDIYSYLKRKHPIYTPLMSSDDFRESLKNILESPAPFSNKLSVLKNGFVVATVPKCTAYTVEDGKIKCAVK